MVRSVTLRAMKRPFCFLVCAFSLLGACYPREMMREDALTEVLAQPVVLCESLPLAVPTRRLQLAAALSAELGLVIQPCPDVLAGWPQGQPPVVPRVNVIGAHVRVSEVTATRFAWLPAHLQQPELQVQAQLRLEIWRGTALYRSLEVHEIARSHPSDRALLFEKLWEKLVQKALLELQPRYDYR